MSAVDTARHHDQLVKNSYNPLDAMHFLPNFKPRILKFPSANFKNEPQPVLAKAYSAFLPAERNGTGDRAAPRQSSSLNRAAPAAPAVPCKQRSSRITIRLPARIFRTIQSTRVVSGALYPNCYHKVKEIRNK